MKKVIIYLLISVLYLMTPVCIMGILGTGVSLKYEVDEAYIFVDIDQKTSQHEKEIEHNQIDKHAWALRLTLVGWTVGLFACPVAATILLEKRKRILNIQ